MLLDTLGASLLGNILYGKGVNKKGKGVIRAGYGRPLPSSLQKIKWIFNAALFFNKLWNTRVLSK